MSDITDKYRSLTLDEIAVMESHGCTADDWNTVRVAEEFIPDHVRGVTFCGNVYLGVFYKQIEIGEGFMRHAGISNAVLRDVTIGDNCLIENIGCYISRYDIAEECYIAGVGRMATDDGATYGNGNIIPVLNEAGDGNVIIYDGLTSQMAAFMVAHASDADIMARMKDMVNREVEARRPECGIIGYRVKITNTREIINTVVGDDCEINGASLISDCTLTGTPEAGTYIGHDVICENTVVAAGASLTDGAKVAGCFIGEACHIGKGFSAENSLFFANSHMDNGEACAAFCGPFTVSHHKSTLLIGGMYSFFNAGSATNFSNHAYKLGPIHYGTLGRGAKTASGAHLLLPATIGDFSMVMGKVACHPNTSLLPFSYIIASEGKTHIVPGRNLVTVGTWRDTRKWQRRDMRPRNGRRSLVCFDWMNPLTMTMVMQGRYMLESLQETQGWGKEEYAYGDCVISNKALRKGIEYYDMALRLYMGEAVINHYHGQPWSSVGTEEWVDLAGLPAPESEVERLADDIKSGKARDLAYLEESFAMIFNRYEDYKWNCAHSIILDYYEAEMLTDTILQCVKDGYESALSARNAAIKRDAEHEYDLGDVDESLLRDFLDKFTQEQ